MSVCCKGVDNPERFLNIQEQQPESNQNLNALLPVIGMLAGEVNKDGNKEVQDKKPETNEFEKFINNVEELIKQEV